MDAIAHEEVVPQLAEHLRPILESSPDGVYGWLDETHWTCNENLASMSGTTGHTVAHRFVRKVGD